MELTRDDPNMLWSICLIWTIYARRAYYFNDSIPIMVLLGKCDMFWIKWNLQRILFSDTFSYFELKMMLFYFLSYLIENEEQFAQGLIVLFLWAKIAIMRALVITALTRNPSEDILVLSRRPLFDSGYGVVTTRYWCEENHIHSYTHE